MTRILFNCCIALFFFHDITAEEYTVTGAYQGRNLYVQNPLSSDRINFCTQNVYVNDELIISNPKTSAYEIDLEQYEVGDPLVIRIQHRSGCTPKIINPQVIRVKSRFRFLSVNADENEISWMTTGEYQEGVFSLELYEHHDWKVEETVYGKGNFEVNQYSVAPYYHAGENKLRIKYETENGKVFYSRVFDFFSNKEPVSFYPVRVTDKLFLSRKADYEVVDQAGNTVAQGNAREINCSNLQSGLYYLNIDNRTEKFFKK